MHRLDALERFSADLKIPKESGFDIPAFARRAKESLAEIIESEEELAMNRQLIEKLVTEEAEITELLRINRESFCRMEDHIEELEMVLKVRKNFKEAVKKESQNMFENLKLSANIETSSANNVMNRLGFRIKLQLIETNGQKAYEIMFTFAENHSTTLHYNVNDSTYELKSIEPPHPAFKNIREFLDKTQDMHGFLCALKRHHFTDTQASTAGKRSN